ncbi:restriction endonuclease subunit S [Streptomyces caelestis]|jgi:type I restriction enzyme S subunit|uniref:restriction endonuclease subunit S n=1 Tax=Streptomyces caelestis TaxID=36816 RepID=UPI003804519A
MGGHAGQGEFTTLGETVTRTGGVIQTGPFGSQLHASDYTLLGTPLIMPINLGDNEVIEAGISRIGDKDVRRLRRHALREGDIVFSRRGDVGRRSIIQAGQAGWLCGTGCLAARFGARRTEVNPEYVAHYLGSRPAQTWLQDHAVGGTMPNLNTAILSALPIRLPARPYQDVVVAMLEDAQAAVEHVRILIAKKQAIKQGLMQRLLTGQTRLPGHTEEWSTGPLKDFLPLQRGFDLPTPEVVSGPYPVVYSNGVGRHHTKAMAKGPGVVTGRSGTIGKVHFIEDDYWPHNTALWVTSFARVDAKFAYYFLAYLGLERFASGSGVPTFNRNDAHSFEITVPPDRAEQKAIADVLSAVDSELEALRRRLDKASSIKTGMMQELLTGRKRLPVEGETAA